MTESRYEVRCGENVQHAEGYDAAGVLGEQMVVDSRFEIMGLPEWRHAYITNLDRGEIELELFYSPGEERVKGYFHFRHSKSCTDCGEVLPLNKLACEKCAIARAPHNPAGAPRKPWSKRNRPDTGDNFLFDGPPLRIH